MIYLSDYEYVGTQSEVTEKNPHLTRDDIDYSIEHTLDMIGLTPEHEDYEWAKWQPLLVGIENGMITEVYVVQGSQPYLSDAPVYKLKLGEKL